VAIKQLVDGSDISLEEGKLRFEQEISIIWSISSHPHIITLVGYSENPRLIITKVFLSFLFLSFFRIFTFLILFLNSYMMKI